MSVSAVHKQRTSDIGKKKTPSTVASMDVLLHHLFCFFIYLSIDIFKEGSLISDPTLLSIRALCSFVFGIKESLLYDTANFFSTK